MSVDLATASAKKLAPVLATDDPKPLLVTGEQAAKLLSCCPKTVRNLAKRGILTPVKLGAATRYRLSQLRELAEGTET